MSDGRRGASSVATTRARRRPALDAGRQRNASVRWPIGAVFILRHRPGLKVPDLRELGPAEASARLYVTALNVLAHANHGLDAVVRVVEHAPCFALDSADLSSTCALIRSVVAEAHLRAPQ